MSYTSSEARNFYWHCKSAALLLEGLELNTATRVHVGNAVRMATLCALGKNGIKFVSQGATELRGVSQTPWAELGLIREHVVPISVIAKGIVEDWKSGRIHAWRDVASSLEQKDLSNWEVLDSDYFLESPAPLSAVVAMMVRKKTVLAWITVTENKVLQRRGLAKTMPADHGDDPLARYKACEIRLVEL